MPEIGAPSTTQIDTIAIGAIVTILTQFAKAAIPFDRTGPWVAALISGLAVGVWVYSSPDWPPPHTMAWPIFAAWANVLTVAIGIYHGSQVLASSVASRRRRPTRERARTRSRVQESENVRRVRAAADEASMRKLARDSIQHTQV